MNTKPKATRADVQAALGELDNTVVNLEDHERRKHLAASKQRRQDLSDDALLLECLFDLFDLDADERGYMHALVARSLGKAPGQVVIVNEVELGRQLKGDAYVLEGSIKKRARRMYAQVDAKQRAKGRQMVARTPGKVVLGHGKESGTNKRFAARGDKKLISAEYLLPVVQGVVDGVDAARPGRERRVVRFRRAARVVFDSLPSCKPLPVSEVMTPFVRTSEDGEADVTPSEAFERATGERPRALPALARQQRGATQPRPLKRVKDSAALALRVAQERDTRRGDGRSEEFDRQAALLQVEVSRTIAEVRGGESVTTEAAIRETIALLQSMLAEPELLSSIVACSDTPLATSSLPDNENDSAGVAQFSDPETPKPQQKGTSDPLRLDKSVQARRPSGRIPDEVVERVRVDSDLRRVVESRGVRLARVGSQYKGLCPFHQEKTPSFFISPAKGLYHCQGCKAGGNVFNFIADVDRVGFRDAVQTVAGICGIPLPELEPVTEDGPKAARAPRELTVVRDDEGSPEFAEDFTL
jgi:hypothetical protein